MSPRSFFWLAVHLLGRLLAALFGRGRGYDRFVQGYVLREGLLPVDPELRALGREAGRCIGCGACEVRLPQPPPSIDGPQQVLLCATRSLHRLEQALPSLRWLRAQPLEAAEAACPRRVPIGRLVEGLCERAEQAAAQRAEAAPDGGRP